MSLSQLIYYFEQI